jgi:hypothetical protein
MVVGRFETHPIHMKDPGHLSLRFNARMPEHAMTGAAIIENDTDIPALLEKYHIGPGSCLDKE